MSAKLISRWTSKALIVSENFCRQSFFLSQIEVLRWTQMEVLIECSGEFLFVFPFDISNFLFRIWRVSISQRNKRFSKLFEHKRLEIVVALSLQKKSDYIVTHFTSGKLFDVKKVEMKNSIEINLREVFNFQREFFELSIAFCGKVLSLRFHCW